MVLADCMYIHRVYMYTYSITYDCLQYTVHIYYIHSLNKEFANLKLVFVNYTATRNIYTNRCVLKIYLQNFTVMKLQSN